tara:strand:+ start:1403 stop:1846 length:444 start_codon:yes stop_codon:yes gene_type:complete
MAKVDNPVLGTIDCPDCGGVASVKQVRRGKGRFLYSNCGSCGTDQRNGLKVQERLFFGTSWREGVDVIKPPCIAHLEKEPLGSSESVVQPNEVSVDAGLVEKVIEQEIEPKPVKKQPSEQPTNNRKGGLFMGLLLALSLGAAAVVIK